MNEELERQKRRNMYMHYVAHEKYYTVYSSSGYHEGHVFITHHKYEEEKK